MQRTSRTFGVKGHPFALLAMAGFAGGACGLATSASATVVTDGNSPTIAGVTYGNPSSGGFSSSYEDGNDTNLDRPSLMFANGTVANIGTTPVNPNNTYADSGYFPNGGAGQGTTGSMNDLSPVVSVDYGATNTFSANAIVFAQRDTKP